MMQLFHKTIQTEERFVVFGILFAVAVTFLVYGFYVNQTVSNIVARKSAEYQMSETVARISQLEAEYSDLRDAISYEYAYNMGYVEPASRSFVSLGGPVRNLSGAF
jgi:cell division protein FtsB